MQKVPLHVTLVTLAKNWPVCQMRENTLHGMALSTFSRFEYIVPLTSLRGGISLLLTLYSGYGVLFQIRWLAIPLWPLKIICVMLLGFMGHLMVHFLSLKPLNSELIVEIFEGISMLPTIHRHLVCGCWSIECWNSFFLSKSRRSGNTAMPRKGSSHLGHFQVMIRTEGVGSFIALFWKFRILSWPFLGMMLFFLS